MARGYAFQRDYTRFDIKSCCELAGMVVSINRIINGTPNSSIGVWMAEDRS